MSSPSDKSSSVTSSSVSLKFGDLIRQFDGREDFAEWIRKVEMIADLQNIGKKESFIPLFLSGGAFAVYESLDTAVKKDYGKLKDALLKAFSVNIFAAFEALVSRIYHQDESVDVYLADIRRLVKLISTTADNEEWVRCAFVRGLPENIRSQLQALSSIEKMAMTDLVERTRVMMSFDTNSQNPTSFMARAIPRPTRRVDDRRCFSCGEVGHIARWCRNSSNKSFDKRNRASRGATSSDTEPKNE